MPAVRQVLLDDPPELGVEQKSAGQSVEQGGEAVDGGDGHHPAGTDDASGLGQSGQALGAVGEVVERTEEQNGVEGVVGEIQMAGVADARP